MKEFALEVLVIALMGVLWVSVARADGPDLPQSKTFDVVRHIDQIPYGQCRYVLFPPTAVDRLTLPESTLMCNTLGVVGVVDYSK